MNLTEQPEETLGYGDICRITSTECVVKAHALQSAIDRLLAVHDQLLASNDGCGYIDCSWPPETRMDADLDIELFDSIEALKSIVRDPNQY